MIDALCLGIVGLSVLLAFYCVVAFPFLLWVVAKAARRPWRESDVQPTVTVIIPAHNEAAVIARKLDNILAAEYPAEALEVIVASDCSTDETDAIVQSYAPRVRLVRAETRSGKQVCLNLAAARSTAEILLFTDAASLLPTDAIPLLVRHFGDPSIGAASSAIRVHRGDAGVFAALPSQTAGRAGAGRQGRAEGEGIYLGADCAMRVLEGRISSMVGCVGAGYAIRRASFLPFDASDCDDFASAYSVLVSGQRAIMDPRVVSYMLPARDLKVELSRKIRTISGAIATGWRYRGRILKFAPVSVLWFFVSHKICRWLLPLALVASALAIAVGAAFGHWTWRVPFAFEAAGGAMGLVALRFSWKVRRLAILKPFGFVLVSIYAAVIAWCKVFWGQKQVLWQPTPRAEAGPMPASAGAARPSSAT